MEELFYETWRKTHGITIDGYQLNRKQLFEMMKDFRTQIEQSHKHSVMQGLPTEEDIRAAGLKLTAHLTIEPMLRDMAKRYFRQGARWAISNMSGSPTVGKAGGDASVSDGK